MTSHDNPSKKRKLKHNNDDNDIAPIMFGELEKNSSVPRKMKHLRVLLDSGASGSMIHSSFIDPQQINSQDKTQWATMSGTFVTRGRVKVGLKLPEFDPGITIKTRLNVTDQKGSYDIILGRDILRKLGITLDFKNSKITMQEYTVDMKPYHCTRNTHYEIKEPVSMEMEMERFKRILDAKYEKADLEKIVDESTHLLNAEREKLLAVLQKYEVLFDGTLGQWTGTEYKIDLREDATPYHGRPYGIPKAYEQTFKLEVERLCKVGVLRKINRSEWGAPTFLIPKKDQTVRFISDFRELNKRIKRKPFPIPKIQDMLLKLEGFQYATSLDLNMGYYHIELHPDSKKLCTIVLPWGKYEYNKLPMGLCNSPDIFQEKMYELFEEFEYVRAYIDDLLVISNDSYEDHLNKLDKVLQKLQNAGLKVNANKSFFSKTELEYLGYWITREGIMPVPKKIKAISNIAIPKNKKTIT